MKGELTKSVLLSVRPQWCAKIANREKTLEIRKSRPKQETPFKCYIYCTQDKEHTLFKDWIDPPFVVKEYNIMNGKGVKNVFGDNRPWGNANGKVIGEFVCDQIYQYSTGNIEGQTISSEEMQKQSCLTYDELSEYENSAEPRENCIYLMGLYGWHISALQIYDKPRELSEFYHYLPDKILDSGDYDCRGGGEVVCMDMPEGGDDCAECPYGGRVYLKRSPQSWCYVEGE